MARRIRVLCAIGSLGGGGSERQFLGILRRLDRSRFEPQLYLLERCGELLPDVPDDVPVAAFSDDARPSRLSVPGRIHRRQVAHLTEQLRRGRYDLLFERTLLMTLVAGPAAARAGTPRVASIAANPVLDAPNHLRRFRWWKERIARRAYRDARTVVVNSDALGRTCIEHYGLDPTRVRTVPNGFDFDLIRRRAAEPGPEREPGGFHIAGVGRLAAEKRFDLLIDAVRILVRERGREHVRLRLIGQGPLEAEYRRAVRSLGLEQHVEFTGFLRNPWALMSRSDAVVLTSSYEGSPNVLVEAMVLGVPVISTDCPHGPAEILDGGRLGVLIPPPAGSAAGFDQSAGSAAVSRALADALTELMAATESGDPALRSRQEAARQSVEQRFRIETSVAALAALLESAAAVR